MPFPGEVDDFFKPPGQGSPTGLFDDLSSFAEATQPLVNLESLAVLPDVGDAAARSALAAQPDMGTLTGVAVSCEPSPPPAPEGSGVCRIAVAEGELDGVAGLRPRVLVLSLGHGGPGVFRKEAASFVTGEVESGDGGSTTSAGNGTVLPLPVPLFTLVDVVYPAFATPASAESDTANRSDASDRTRIPTSWATGVHITTPPDTSTPGHLYLTSNTGELYRLEYPLPAPLVTPSPSPGLSTAEPSTESPEGGGEGNSTAVPGGGSSPAPPTPDMERLVSQFIPLSYYGANREDGGTPMYSLNTLDVIARANSVAGIQGGAANGGNGGNPPPRGIVAAVAVFNPNDVAGYVSESALADPLGYPIYIIQRDPLSTPSDLEGKVGNKVVVMQDADVANPFLRFGASAAQAGGWFIGHRPCPNRGDSAELYLFDPDRCRDAPSRADALRCASVGSLQYKANASIIAGGDRANLPPPREGFPPEDSATNDYIGSFHMHASVQLRHCPSHYRVN
eukprot:TRINITY_DN36035_c0_g1_i2.p1 TRINITY_DN36035_c0_g1~~TRINITY_DN36035_c0_g1_i2.p1  ORF type:complete len:541 (+),score=91.85 TRINITY_DN36035_c0_g1_i2:102-1625(+)